MAWNVEVVDSIAAPSDAAIVLDSVGAPHIAYLAGGVIYHAWKAAGVWTKETAVSPGISGYGWWTRKMSLAIGDDVLHVTWATGGYTHAGNPVYPNVPVVGTAIEIHHAYSTVGSGSWSEEVVWTGDADDAAGYWTDDGFGGHYWTWTAQHSTYSHGVAIAADSLGNGHIAFGYEYQGNVPSSGTHQAIHYLNGADSWSETIVMTDTDVDGAGSGAGFTYASTHPVFCDVNDDVHIFWFHNNRTEYNLEYAKGPGFAVTEILSTLYDDYANDYEPISVSADSAGDGQVFFVNGENRGSGWRDYALVGPVGGAYEDVGYAYTGGLVLTDDVSYVAYTDSGAASITYDHPVSGTWTTEAVAPANNAGYVDLAQATTAPMIPHVTWCMSILGAVMYAGPGGIYAGATMF